MNAEIFAVRVVRRTGHQKDNERGWPIGAYLRWRPEDEQAMGPGGFARYEACELSDAEFGDRLRAYSAVEYMRKTYPGIECEAVRFVEAP